MGHPRFWPCIRPEPYIKSATVDRPIKTTIYGAPGWHRAGRKAGCAALIPGFRQKGIYAVADAKSACARFSWRDTAAMD